LYRDSTFQMATAFQSGKWFCLIRASCPERRSRTSSSWVWKLL